MWLCYRATCVFLAICGSIVIGAKLSEEQKLFVDQHNAYRSAANPPAANMKKMEWNSTLESLAKKRVSDCIHTYGQPSNTINEWIGQNIYWTTNPDDIIIYALRYFHYEVEYYDLDSNTCPPNRECGHYTQLMWADSYKLGCAVSPPHCPEGHIVVCNYLPGGNYVRRKPYVQGASCSQCEMGWKGGCDNKLCTRNDEQTKPMSEPMEKITKSKCKNRL